MTRAILSVWISNLLGVWKPEEESPFFFCGSFFLIILAPTLWFAWTVIVAQVNPLASSHWDRRVLYLTPPICLLLLAFFLLTNNAGDPLQWTAQLLFGYITCAFWLGGLNWSPSFLGIEA